MKISKTKLYYALLVICMLSQNKFFHLYNGSTANTIFSIAIIGVLWFMARNDYLQPERGFLDRYLGLVVIAIVLPQTVYAFSQGETIEGYFNVIRGIMYLFLCVPVYKMMSREKSEIRILEIIALLTTITCFLILMNSMSWNVMNKQLIPFDYFQKPQREVMRNGKVRVVLISEFIAFAPLYTWCSMLYNKVQKKHVVEFLICITTLFYVEQTRVLCYAVLAACIIVVINCMTQKKRIIFIYLASSIILLGLVAGVIAPFEGFLSQNNSFYASNMIRIAEFNYAFELIKKHPILGTGLVSQHLYLKNFVFDGIHYLYGYSDIGIVGTISYIGLVGTSVIFILPMMRCIDTIKAFPSDKKKNFEYAFMIALIVYIFVTSTTLMVTDTVRIFVWPFIIAFFEYERKCIKKGECNQV